MSRARARQFDRLYAQLPHLACKGFCQASCVGAIAMTPTEAERVGVVGDVDSHGRCPKLDHASGRCTVYNHRPLICRLWGVVEGQECPHGCKPSRYLTINEAFGALREAERIGGRMTVCTHPALTEIMQ